LNNHCSVLIKVTEHVSWGERKKYLKGRRMLSVWLNKQKVWKERCCLLLRWERKKYGVC